MSVDARPDASEGHRRGHASEVRWEGDASEGHRGWEVPAVARCGRAAIAATDERGVRLCRHHRAMAWESFRMQDVDDRTARGYARIGRLVQRRRERLGLSQRQLQILSGIDQSVISRLETGQLRGLRFSRFARLVDALGGIGDADPLPARATRYMPSSRDARDSLAQVGD